MNSSDESFFQTEPTRETKSFATAFNIDRFLGHPDLGITTITMRDTGGTDFDPVFVDTFLNAFNRNEMEVPEVLTCSAYAAVLCGTNCRARNMSNNTPPNVQTMVAPVGRSSKTEK
jgi:hypothetical protein